MPNPIERLGLWLARNAKSRTTSQTLPRYQPGRPYPRAHELTNANALRDAYKPAGIVYACIRLIADTATSVPLNTYERGTDDSWTPTPNTPLQALLDSPNPTLTRRRIRKRVIQHLMLTGNAILTKVRVPKSGPTTQLWPINPDLVTPVPGDRDLISHYELRVDGKAIRLEARDVIHLQLENPESPWWGMGPLQAAMLDVNLYKANKAWNLRTVEHGAVTPGVLEVPEDLSLDQFTTLREQLDARSFGYEDAGRELILGSGMKYHRMSLTGEELGFLESMRFGREEIAMIFGVPAPLLSPENATLANVEAYDRQFWQNTIVPLNDGIADEYTLALVPEFGGDPTRITIAHDYSSVPAMQENLNEQADAAEKLVRTGFTVAGVNRMLDLGFGEDEIEEPEPVPETLAPFAGAAPAAQIPDEEAGETRARKSKRQKDARVDRLERDRVAWDDRIASTIAAVFEAERDAVVSAYLADATIASATTTIRANASAWRDTLQTTYMAVAEHFARLEYDALAPKTRKDFDPTNLAAEWAARAAAAKVTYISDTTIAMIRQVIAAGLTPDLDGNTRGTPAIARDIADTYDMWAFTGPNPNMTIDSRAYMIARTEVNAAANYGNSEGARQISSEYDLPLEKVWNSPMDPPRAREDHMALHGVAVLPDESFPNGLMYPGDPTGDASEVVNCFPADTEVAGRVRGAFRRWYSGFLVEVRTREGKKLAGTPNHPVLTDKGWVPLKHLAEGHHLVCHSEHVNGAIGHHVKARPAKLGEVFDALAVASDPMRVDGRGVDFHGETPDGEVDVVRVNGELRLDGKPALRKFIADLQLPASDATEPDLVSGSLSPHLLGRSGAPAPGLVRGGGERAPFVDARAGHADAHSVAAIATLDASPGQEAGQAGSADADLDSESLLGLPGEVSTDEVVGVVWVDWSGHVYNLSTATERYVANGIVVHNCRCIVTHRLRR